MSYEKETRILLANGRSLCGESFEQNPNGTDYLRVLDEQGREIAYWSQNEWRDEPEFVLGAVMGALMGGRPDIEKRPAS